MKKNGSYMFILVVFFNLIALVDVCAYFPEAGPNKMPRVFVNLSDYEISVEIEHINTVSYMKLAVWSEKDGQDDIRWYPIENSLATDVLNFDVPLSDFSDTGKYLLHLWAFKDENTPDEFITHTEVSVLHLATESDIENRKDDAIFDTAVDID